MFILSLGSIVKTDAAKAIGSFQALTNELDLEVKISSLMPQLQPLFIAFNLGKLITEDFKEKVLGVIFEQSKHKDDHSKKEAFLERFASCWNAMCEIDMQVIDVFKYIANASSSVADANYKMTIYSDTNPLHFAHLESAMRQGGLDPATIQTTFVHQCPKEMLLRLIVDQSSGATKSITLVLGKNDKITDPVLLAMTEQRDIHVLETASSVGVMIERFTEPRVSVEYLESLTSRAPARESTGFTAAFDTMRLRQDLSNTTAAQEASTEEPKRAEHFSASP